MTEIEPAIICMIFQVLVLSSDEEAAHVRGPVQIYWLTCALLDQKLWS